MYDLITTRRSIHSEALYNILERLKKAGQSQKTSLTDHKFDTIYENKTRWIQDQRLQKPLAFRLLALIIVEQIFSASIALIIYWMKGRQSVQLKGMKELLAKVFNDRESNFDFLAIVYHHINSQTDQDTLLPLITSSVDIEKQFTNGTFL